MSDQPCVIEIEKLTTRFGEHLVYENLDLCVKRDEVMALVGASGSGKTTLLRQVLGLHQADSGTIKVFGQNLNEQDGNARITLRNRWGVLFQEGALFSALSVFDNVALPLRELRVLDEPIIRDIVMLKLQMVEIAAEQVHIMPAELSGGMVKRVALARALALEPELLFLDEPTAGLDPERSESFVKLIETLRKALCLTVVMVTHDLDTLAALADRVAVLADQHLIAVDTLAAVVAIKHPFIEGLFNGERGKHIVANIGQQKPTEKKET